MRSHATSSGQKKPCRPGLKLDIFREGSLDSHICSDLKAQTGIRAEAPPKPHLQEVVETAHSAPGLQPLWENWSMSQGGHATAHPSSAPPTVRPKCSLYWCPECSDLRQQNWKLCFHFRTPRRALNFRPLKHTLSLTLASALPREFT